MLYETPSNLVHSAVSVAIEMLPCSILDGAGGREHVGHTVPCESRFLVHLLFALSASFCTAALGGEAAASGKIPIFKKNPMAFSATGGIAVLVIALVLLHYLYSC